ncbi:MAG TPA: DUF4115 domain-containing protein [Methylophilaceae bacterium]|nr:DUF4115 domain-containing protein [Methylophilaceae bacterium]HQC29384.1 DUF4115 domain-containing protein [Methylotenera sp.]
MTDEVKSNASVDQNFAPLGEVLLAARKAKKLTQKDISNSLKLSIKQIDAIEKNEFSALPDATNTRGFIRNYARLLNVEAEPLLASFRARVPEVLPTNLSVQSSTRYVKLSKESLPWLKYILASILVLLFLLAWFFYMDYMPKPYKLNQKNPVATPEVSTTLEMPEIALPAAERQAYSADSANNAVNTVDAAPLVSPTVDPNVVSANQTSQPATTESTENSPVSALNATSPSGLDASITPTGKVMMTFSDETWVRVTNQSGKVVFEKTFSANSSGVIDDTPPLNLVIGNAKATQLQYLGQSVDLTSSTKGNVARITLN